MKNIISNIKRILAVAAISATVLSTSAQALRTGYFLEGNLFRYRLNPALMSARGHFSLPVLGGVGINTMGNVGMSNFLYESPLNSNELVTFMHPSVDASDFLGGLDSENRLAMSLDLTVLSTAFYAFGGFNSIDLTVRSQTGMNIPYGMFRFMKEMGAGEHSFSDLRMQTRNYVDLSIGHARDINEQLTVGARIKFLFGLAYADVNFDRMKMTMAGDQWRVSANGTADIAIGGKYTYSDKKTINGKTIIDGYDDVSVGLQGYGLGFDIGATYDLSDVLVEGLSASASLTDVGYIKWSDAARAAVSPEDEYVFDGFKDIEIHDGDGSLDNQFEDLGDDLEDFFALEDKGEGSVSTGIGAKFNIGAEYKMPFYNKLSAGFLYTHCFDDMFSYDQASLMISVSPLKVLDFAVSGTVADYGAGFGAMANLHCTGFNFFIGTDCFIGKVGKQFVPLESMDASVTFGVNIGFGRPKDRN